MQAMQGQGGWRSIGAGLLLSCAALVAFDVVLGLVALRDGRFLSFYVPPYDLVFTERQRERVQAEDHAYGRFDATLGWTIKSGGRSDDGLYRANAAGFRANREYAAKPPPGVLRMASFGDSYTHGAEVGNDDTWQHQLESAVPDLEVLNFGVDAYGVDQAYLRYREVGAAYAPEIVLIGFLIENVNRSVSVYRPAYYHQTRGVTAKPRFRIAADGSLELVPLPVSSREELMAAIESGSLLPVLRETDYWVQRAPLAWERSPLFWSSVFRIAYGRYASAGRNLRRHYAAGEDSEPFRVTLAVIDAFYREALERGAREALVIVFPDQAALREVQQGEPAYWQSLGDALESRGVPVLDVTGSLLEAARDRELPELFSGYHYSRAGNGAVAEALRRRLLTSGS